MGLKENSEIQSTLKWLKSGMLDYMEHASYTKNQVEKCLTIIDDYLNEMEKSNSKEEGMDLVKRTVLALNELNEECEEELIETDQREHLAEIIILTGHLKGYNDKDDDITEDWREW